MNTGLVTVSRCLSSSEHVQLISPYYKQVIDSQLGEAIFSRLADSRRYSVWVSDFVWLPYDTEQQVHNLETVNKYALVLLLDPAEAHVGDYLTDTAIVQGYYKGAGSFVREHFVVGNKQLNVWKRYA